ncbi:MAG: CsbD family protein [Planctomycetota bacterium]
MWSGRWKQVRGKIRETWGDLADDELDQVAGRRDQLIGRIQERTGEDRNEISKRIERFESESTRK